MLVHLMQHLPSIVASIGKHIAIVNPSDCVSCLYARCIRIRTECSACIKDMWAHVCDALHGETQIMHTVPTVPYEASVPGQTYALAFADEKFMGKATAAAKGIGSLLEGPSRRPGCTSPCIRTALQGQSCSGSPVVLSWQSALHGKLSCCILFCHRQKDEVLEKVLE